MVRKSVVAILMMSALVATGDGDARISIVLPQKPTLSEQFAAKELKYHLEKATDRKFEIVDENSIPSQGRRFFIGNVKALSGIGVKYADFKIDERLLKGVGGDVYFVGGEPANFDSAMKRIPKHIKASWGFGRGGTLYAVYDFLECEMGVKWIWPGEFGEIIPKRSVPDLNGIERRGVEPLVYRIAKGDQETRIENKKHRKGWKDYANAFREVDLRRLWLTRNRIGIKTYYRSGHAFEDWHKRFKSNLGYFAMQPSGLRGTFSDLEMSSSRNKYYPICVSNPEVHDVIVKDWALANKDSLAAGQKPLNVNCCENDAPGFCVCERCRSWDAEDSRFAAHSYWNGTIKDVPSRNRFLMALEQWGDNGEIVQGSEPPSVSDRYVKFYNAVLAKARKIHPEAEVFGYAYCNYRLPPKSTKVAEGVVISFVPSALFPYSRAESDAFRTEWDGWRNMGATSMFYRPNYMHAGGNMPYSSARRIAEDINYAYASGALKGIYHDSLLGVWSAQAMKNYAMARLLREPDAAYAKIASEFYSAFGAAGEDVGRYCEMLEALNDKFSMEEWTKIGLANRAKNGAPGGRWSNFILAVANLYSEEWFAFADSILDCAEKKVDGIERIRVAFLRKGLRDGLLSYRARVAQKSGDEAAFQAAFSALVEYRASVEADNVCGWAYFADVESTHAGWPH